MVAMVKRPLRFRIFEDASPEIFAAFDGKTRQNFGGHEAGVGGAPAFDMDAGDGRNVGKLGRSDEDHRKIFTIREDFYHREYRDFK